jgi:hypothetical protein
MRPAASVLVLLTALGSLDAGAPKTPPSDFDRAIAPLLTQHCLDCHAGPRPRGGLDLTRRQSALAGGDKGHAVVPGKPDDSILWQYVNAGKMPPKRPLPEKDKAALRAWIEAGAPWGTDPIDPFRVTTDLRAGYDWWSLRPVRRPDPPRVRREDWPRNPIDAFVLARLEEKGLRPAPEASPRVLVRRLYFDLIGLPPPPEEVEAFARDPSDRAYRALVDRLLASPQHGVRWARHWLDVARYGESDGFERNAPRPAAWHYRDWVVEALNADMPYDEFARLQIAGDVLRPNDPAGVRATGFLVAGIHNTVLGQNEVMRLTARHDELEDMAGTLGQAFLGLTVHCARCHDHKFDPVGMKDYYRLVASLAGVTHGERPVADPAKGPRGQAPVFAVKPQPPPATHVLARGDVRKKLDLVSAGGVAAAGGTADFGLAPGAPEGERRRRLAEWVARADNPLFARVAVNRLWHHHFGAGIVDTPSDLGFNGGRPSHPELLDWLAAELVARRFSLREMHRLIVTSAAYRQAAAGDPKGTAADAGNRLLWRKAPLRLEAEALRDAMLAAAGQLNPRLGGPGFHDVRTYHNNGTTYYEPTDPAGPEFHRRTLYRFSPRGERSALLETFDCPDPSAATPRRQVTTTPLQALALLNGSFVLRMADRFAERVAADVRAAGQVGTDAKVRRAFAVAFGRAPDADEARLAAAFAERHGLPALCRVLFNSNEFVVIE